MTENIYQTFDFDDDKNYSERLTNTSEPTETDAPVVPLSTTLFDDANDEVVDADAKLPNGFLMMSDGLKYISATKEGEEPKEIAVCQRFEIVARCTDANGENPGTMITWIDREGNPHDWVVPEVMAHTERKELVQELVRQNFQCEVGIGASNALKNLFAWVAPKTHVTAFDRAGWQQEGRLFLMPNGDSFGQGGAMFTNRKKTLNRQACDLSEWKSEVATKALGNSRLMMALAASFLGPLIEVANEEFSAFHFVGSSSIGKSTAAFLAASVWGLPNAHDQIRSWRATDNGLEGTAAECTDTILILDEMGQVDPRVIGECVYMLANGAGKARASRDGSAREVRRWRLSVISTGELTVESALKSLGKYTPGGLDVRMINLPADAGAGMGMFENTQGMTPKVFADTIKLLSTKSYGTAGRAFVEHLTALRNDVEGEMALRDRIGELTRDFCAKYTPAKADGQIGRVVQKFALAAAAGELASSFGVLPFEEGVVTSGVGACVTAWLNARGSIRPKEETDVIARVREFIVTHGDSRFEKRVQSDDSSGIRDRAGWMSADGDYQFALDVFKRIAAPMDALAAAKVLERAGYLTPKVSKDLSKTEYNYPARVGGELARVYCVRASIIESE